MIDVLQGRDADTLTAWLIAHPGVEVISRDSAGDYMQGTRLGAPEAIRIADRWHLLNTNQHHGRQRWTPSLGSAPLLMKLVVRL